MKTQDLILLALGAGIVYYFARGRAGAGGGSFVEQASPAGKDSMSLDALKHSLEYQAQAAQVVAQTVKQTPAFGVLSGLSPQTVDFLSLTPDAFHNIYGFNPSPTPAQT